MVYELQITINHTYFGMKFHDYEHRIYYYNGNIRSFEIYEITHENVSSSYRTTIHSYI